MSVTIVVGAQWGDEAKGKIVDLLAAESDWVVRYNGGDNAGHTVINDLGTFKLQLIPSGFSNPKAICAIGPGVVVNLATLIKEIDDLQSKGIDLSDRLWVSPRCNVIMPYHAKLEGIYEEVKGGGRTGTTGHGIGPVYADKVSYNGVRLYDLENETILKEKLRIQLGLKNALFKAFGEDELAVDAVKTTVLGLYAKVRDRVKEPFGMLQEALAKDAPILMEGAQGALLDNTWGTYPFCTASTTLSGGITGGAGIPPQRVTRVVGVSKAYTTRVGGGPFPTELLDATGDAIRKAGNEFGTITGRPRRCGWLDAELLSFTAQLNGYTDVAITKLDVLDQMSTLKICTGYRHSGQEGLLHYWDGDARWLGEVEPVYVELPGWQQSTKGVTDFSKLPTQAQAYVRKVEEISGVPVAFVSTGPHRDETIRLR